MRRNSKKIKEFFSDADIPFEPLGREISEMKLNENELILLAERKDIPDDVVLRFSEGEKEFSRTFACKFITSRDRMTILSDTILNYFVFTNPYPDMYDIRLMGLRLLPDRIKKAFVERYALQLVTDANNVRAFDLTLLLLEEQASFPEDCMPTLVLASGIIKKDSHRSLLGTKLPNLVNCMMASMLPLEDNEFDKIFKYLNEENTSFSSRNFWSESWSNKKEKEILNGSYLKLASNPSISDYAIMELLVKSPPHFLNDIKTLVDFNEEKRSHYRGLVK